MLAESDLIALTQQTLPDWPVPERLEAIVKGGSDRHYYRLHFPGEARPPAILMTYTLARPDNPRFVPATSRLEKLGVHVPHIYAHDEINLCVWIEDLGAVDLHAFRESPWSVREPLYQKALAEAAKLHQVNADALTPEDLSEMELSFDLKLYEWEQNYFMIHFVQGMLQKQITSTKYAEGHRALKALRRRLVQLPRGLVHRDFQSQNVLIRDDQAWLIDYQGVRPGLAEYDLASLLLDPYVEMSEEERKALLRWYADQYGRNFGALHETYFLCAAQRLMQALGAYANLSRNLGKPSFEQHIPTAVARLRDVCDAHPLLVPLKIFLA